MKSTNTILAVAIVIAGVGSFGCGTPCDDFLTDLQVDDVDTAIDRVWLGRLFGITREDALQSRLERLDCECLDCECRDCAEWLIDSVY